MYRRIAVGFDRSSGSRRALEAAVDLARSGKAELFLVSIEELPRYPGAIDEVDDEQRSSEKFFEEVQDEAVRQITGAGLVVHREIRPGHAAQALPHYAMEVGADRSEEHTSELQSRPHLVCRLLLEKKKDAQ